MNLDFNFSDGNYRHKKYDCEPEMVLLVKCCEYYIKKDSVEAIRQLISTYQIEWPRLFELARLHGLVASLYILSMNKIDNVPPRFMTRVRKALINISKRNLGLLEQLLKLENAFEKDGIKIVSYKGLPFAQQFYSNIHERYSVDVDYAIAQDDMKRCKSIMHKMGFKEAKGTLNTKDVKKSRAYHLDYPWIPTGDNPLKFSIDFHWTPAHDILKIPISFNELINDSIQLTINGQSLSSFNKVHQAFIAVIHHGNVDCWGKLRHLLDLALILKTLTQEERQQLEKLCDKYRISKSLQIGCNMIDRLFENGSVDKNNKLITRWLNDILNNKLVGKWTESKGKIKFFIISRDSWLDKFKAAYYLFKYQIFIKPQLD